MLGIVPRSFRGLVRTCPQPWTAGSDNLGVTHNERFVGLMDRFMPLHGRAATGSLAYAPRWLDLDRLFTALFPRNRITAIRPLDL